MWVCFAQLLSRLHRFRAPSRRQRRRRRQRGRLCSRPEEEGWSRPTGWLAGRRLAALSARVPLERRAGLRGCLAKLAGQRQTGAGSKALRAGGRARRAAERRGQSILLSRPERLPLRGEQVAARAAASRLLQLAGRGGERAHGRRVAGELGGKTRWHSEDKPSSEWTGWPANDNESRREPHFAWQKSARQRRARSPKQTALNDENKLNGSPCPSGAPISIGSLGGEASRAEPSRQAKWPPHPLGRWESAPISRVILHHLAPRRRAATLPTGAAHSILIWPQLCGARGLISAARSRRKPVVSGPSR